MDSAELQVSKRKASGAHFTPPELASVLARRLWAVLSASHKQDQPLVVLDPACGDGELLEAFVNTQPEHVDTSVQLLGVENDGDSVEASRRRFEKLSRLAIVVAGDFLDILAGKAPDSLFSEEAAVPAPLRQQADVIIANPPYVRTQILGAAKAQTLARAFELTGRVDLYHAFLVAMTRQLKPSGLLGVITSNRFLTTKGGASLRELLSREYDLIEIMDLGDTKLFEAAVLPSIVIARKKAGKHGRTTPQTKFLRIYERSEPTNGEAESAASVCDLLLKAKTGCYRAERKVYDVTVGTLSIPAAAEPWTMLTSGEADWVEAIDARIQCRFLDVAQTRVGVKTTADNVFVRSDWETLPPDVRPEPELLEPMLSSCDAARWRCGSSSDAWRKVLYTHVVVDGKRRAIDLDRYPKARRYLESHRPQLEGRKYVLDAGRAWYEIWVPQNPSAWRLPKLVFPDISPEPKFFFDAHGCLVDGNCYWITMLDGQAPDLLFLLLALANSKLLMRYHDLRFQNRLYAGRRRFLTQYIEQYPVPDLESRAVHDLIETARALSEKNGSARNLEERIDELAAAAFGVKPIRETTAD
jgi:hypothetical protein